MPKKPCSPSRPPKPKRQPEARIDIVLPDGSRLSARGKAAEDLARKALAPAPSYSPPGWHYGPNGWWYTYGSVNTGSVLTTNTYNSGLAQGGLLTSSYTPAVYSAANSPIEDTAASGSKIRPGPLTSASLASNVSEHGCISFTGANGNGSLSGSAAVAAAEAALQSAAKPPEPSA